MFGIIKNKRVMLTLFLCCVVALVGLSGCAVPPAEKAPVAQISATPTTVKMGESITFSATDSTDPDGNIVSYEWDFGDGNTASGATVAYAYSDRGGIYNVRLTVTDDDGLSDTAEVSVNVALATIRIEYTSSTWREGEEPYDIYSAVKDKLEEVGLGVVPEKSASYDATLFIDYKEKEYGEYTSGQHGTSIKCKLKLHDKADNLLLEKDISACTPFTVRGMTLYEATVKNLESQVYFRYLGEIIATRFGVGDEVSLLISALKDESSVIRRDASKALGEIGDKRAVGPLIQALNDEDLFVRKEAATSLGEIGDERAVEPLIQALNDKDADVRSRSAAALGKIGDERAIAPLEELLLTEENEWVRKVIEEALEELRK